MFSREVARTAFASLATSTRTCNRAKSLHQRSASNARSQAYYDV